MKATKLKNKTLEVGAVQYKPAPGKQEWLFYITMTVCIILICVSVVYCGMIFFTASPGTDSYRKGDALTVSDIEDIAGKYDGKLMAENLDLTSAKKKSIELYFDPDGTAENTADWYSLIIRANYTDYSVTMYCMFEDTESVENWKVDMVFTPEATRHLEKNGINVQMARYKPLPDQKTIYYVLFKYQDVVYDLRVWSNKEDCVFTVLEDVLSNI